MFIKLTNQEQKNLLMVLSALFCLWVVWKLINHRHDKLTDDVINSGKLRRLLPEDLYEGQADEDDEEFNEENEDDEEFNEEEDDEEFNEEEEEEEFNEENEEDEEDEEFNEEQFGEDEGFKNTLEGQENENPDDLDNEDYDSDEFLGDTIEGQENETDQDSCPDKCTLFYGLKKCTHIKKMKFESGSDKSAMLKHCKKCKK